MKYPLKIVEIDNRIISYPKNTEEVSKLLKFCSKNKINVIPIGGETNRVDGTKKINTSKNIFINFDKMNKILETDINNMIMTVQCGVKLNKIQKKAYLKKLFFPVNIAPSDKCSIGGNISTNVGGLQTLRFGNIEDHINGLEVVLSDGTILNFLSKLKKDNFGPKLWKIFCGSEGIFGIITKANLKLIPQKKYKSTYLVEIENIAKSINLLKILRKDYYDYLTSFEIIFPIPSQFILKKSFHLIIEIMSNKKKNFIHEILKIFESSNLKIIKIENNILNSWIWKKREEIVYNQSKNNFLEKFDISLPLDKWIFFLNQVDKFLKKNKNFSPYFFGHLGDGNLHCNFKIEPNTIKNGNFLSKFIYNLVLQCGGSIAAEHGLGIKKNDLIKKYKTINYLKFLKNIKKGLDPELILGRNKIYKSD
tara:strand:- start:133 stop:1395 length:1263 start_codon:yes stop_codon:yes gene_type:complete